MKTHIAAKKTVKTCLKLSMALIAMTVCGRGANAATLNEWLFDVPPTGSNFVAYNQGTVGSTVQELSFGVAFQNLQVNGGPFSSTVGGQALFLGTGANYVAYGAGNGYNWSGSTALTLELWVNPTNGVGTTMDAYSDGGNVLRLVPVTGGYHLSAYVYTTSGGYNLVGTGSILIPDNGTWTHIALTYGAGVANTYIGDTADLTNVSIPGSLATSSLAAGNNNIGSFLTSNYFKGYIDEVRTSNVALPLGDGSGIGTIAWDASLAAVPEPGTMALGMTAVGSFLFLRVLRRKRA